MAWMSVQRVPTVGTRAAGELTSATRPCDLRAIVIERVTGTVDALFWWLRLRSRASRFPERRRLRLRTLARKLRHRRRRLNFTADSG